MLESKILKFFPEPIFKYKFEKAEYFNEKLAKYIYGLQKEDLTGLACADPANWNDRIIAPFTGNQVLQACFGNCVSDGTCGSVTATSCNYTIDMQDSYGDGWNGASIDVSVNGTIVANWGLASGAAGSDAAEGGRPHPLSASAA